MSEATERRVFRIPADGHGAVYVEGEDEEEVWTWVQENPHALTSDAADFSVDVDAAYRERVEEVEEPRRPPINAESPTDNTLTGSVERSIPEFPTVGELRAARKRLDLTQADVAEAMGVSSKTVSHYEQGTREISLQRAREYADVLRGAL